MILRARASLKHSQSKFLQQTFYIKKGSRNISKTITTLTNLKQHGSFSNVNIQEIPRSVRNPTFNTTFFPRPEQAKLVHIANPYLYDSIIIKVKVK